MSISRYQNIIKLSDNHFVVNFVIFVTCFILYAKSLSSGYNLDDDNYISNNALTQQGVKAIPRILTSNAYYAEGNISASYRAIPRVSFAIENQLAGQNPHVSHFFNVLLYALICILIFRLILSAFYKVNTLLAVVVTLLFLAHPIHTEVVCSLKNREELFEFFFGILSTICMISYYKYSSVYQLIAGVGFFILSLMSKESGQQFLAIIPLVLFFTQPYEAKKFRIIILSLVISTVVFWATLSVLLDSNSLLFMAQKSNQQVYSYLEHPLLTEGWNIRLGTAFCSVVFYWRLLVLPYPLCCFYGYGMIPLVSITSIYSLSSIVLILILLGFSLSKLRSRSIFSFGILYIAITLSMFANIVIPISGIVDERHTFQASLGYCILLGWLLLNRGKERVDQLLESKKANYMTLCLVVAVLLGYSFVTIKRVPDWKDAKTLITHDMKSSPQSVVLKLYDLKLQLADYGKAKRTIKNTSLLLHKAEPIIKRLKSIVSAYPPSAPLFNSIIGQLYMKEFHRQDSAIVYFSEALHSQETLPPTGSRVNDFYIPKWDIYLLQAEGYMKNGNPGKAFESIRQSANIQYRDPDYYVKKAGQELRLNTQSDSLLFLKNLLPGEDIPIPDRDIETNAP